MLTRNSHAHHTPPLAGCHETLIWTNGGGELQLSRCSEYPGPTGTPVIYIRNLNHSFSFKRGGASKFQTIAGYDLLLPTRTPGPCDQVDATHKRCMNCLDMPAVAVKVSLAFSDTPRVGACEEAVKLVCTYTWPFRYPSLPSHGCLTTNASSPQSTCLV